MVRRSIAILEAASAPAHGPTRHYIGLPAELGDESEQLELPAAQILVMEETGTEVFLIRYSKAGDFAGDTWHPNVDEAMEQAVFEYGERVKGWEEIPADAEPLAVALSHLAGKQPQ
jgi:hypothetical protein